MPHFYIVDLETRKNAYFKIEYNINGQIPFSFSTDGSTLALNSTGNQVYIYKTPLNLTVQQLEFLISLNGQKEDTLHTHWACIKDSLPAPVLNKIYPNKTTLETQNLLDRFMPPFVN